MELQTELGKILQKLNYKDSEVERFDSLAIHFYTIPTNEKFELLAALMWYCGVMEKDGTVKQYYRQHIERYDKLLAED